MFSFDAELTNAVYNLYPESTKPMTDFSVQNKNFRLVLNNVLDDGYIQEELVYKLVQNDVASKLSSIKFFGLMNNFIIVGIGILLFGLIVYSEALFMRKKSIFIEAFFKIKDSDVESELRLVKAFLNSVKKNEQNDALLEEVKEKFILTRDKRRKKLEAKQIGQLQFAKGKSPDLSKLNTKAYILLISALLFQILIVAVCLTIYAIFSDGKSHIMTQVDRAVEANLLFNNFGTIFLTLYEYIVTDGQMTVRNNPIDKEWERDYQLASQYADYFAKLRDTGDRTFLQELDYLLTGDLCLIMHDHSGCDGAREEAKHGLLAISSLMIKATKTVKDAYDRSDKSLAAIKDILETDELQKTEWSYWLYVPPAFQHLEGLLKTQVLNTIKNFQAQSTGLIVTFTVCILIFTELIWKRIWNTFRYERAKLRKMMRVIPVNIIRENSSLRIT